jgi:ethylbenzene dioxygenase beta subunit
MSAPVQVTPELRAEIEAFLYHEAWLLDGERHREWLGLMTDDIHYWMPSFENRFRAGAAVSVQPGRMAHFDDGHADLERRVARFEQDTAWSESPATRHVHAISNIEVLPGQSPDELSVRSVFINYRNRSERDSDLLFGRREDTLRRVGGSWKIARRTIYAAQNVLQSKNLNTFF